MQTAITTTSSPLRYTSTITSKGQITIPQPVRKLLQSDSGRKIEIVIETDGSIRITKPRYSTIDSVAGVVPPLAKPMTMSEIREIIADDIAESYIAKFGK